MHFLPNSNKSIFRSKNKITTYQMLAQLGLPVLSSVLITQNKHINNNDIYCIKNYLNSDHCIIRYQYIVPNAKPIRGGNLFEITKDGINTKMSSEYYLWLLEPINRLTNKYGINIRVSKIYGFATIEIVGKGFDVSSINRGTITPHEIINTALPINFGWDNQWWKFLKISICSLNDYLNSLAIRMDELKELNIKFSDSFFNNSYSPLPYDLLYKLLKYIDELYFFNISEDYVVSLSIDEKGNFVFWDIQLSNEKKSIYLGDNNDSLYRY